MSKQKKPVTESQAQALDAYQAWRVASGAAESTALHAACCVRSILVSCGKGTHPSPADVASVLNTKPSASRRVYTTHWRYFLTFLAGGEAPHIVAFEPMPALPWDVLMVLGRGMGLGFRPRGTIEVNLRVLLSLRQRDIRRGDHTRAIAVDGYDISGSCEHALRVCLSFWPSDDPDAPLLCRPNGTPATSRELAAQIDPLLDVHGNIDPRWRLRFPPPATRPTVALCRVGWEPPTRFGLDAWEWQLANPGPALFQSSEEYADGIASGRWAKWMLRDAGPTPIPVPRFSACLGHSYLGMPLMFTPPNPDASLDEVAAYMSSLPPAPPTFAMP